MSQDISLQIENLETRASEEGGVIKRHLLGEAAQVADHGEASSEEVTRLYLSASAEDPSDPSVYWRFGRQLKQKGAIEAIYNALEERASEDPESSWSAHKSMFGAQHIQEDRRLDGTLRDLVRKHSDAYMWQVYRFVEAEKWRNVQQVFTERAGGERVEGARQTAYFAQEMSVETKLLADLWKTVYQSDREDREAQEALVPLYKDLEKWKEYAEVYRRLLDQLDDEDLRREAINDLIEVYTNHLKSDQVLTDLYAQLFDLDPSDNEIAELLQEKYAKLRKWQNILDILQTRTDILEVAEQQGDHLATEQRIGLLVQRADILQNQLRKADDAQELYESIVEESPRELKSLDALSQIYERKRDWERWAQVRLQSAEAIDIPEESAAQLRGDALIIEKKVRQPAFALRFWERALELEDEPKSLLAIASIYEAQQSWVQLDELISHIDQHPDIDETTRVTWLQKGGTLALDNLDDRDKALERWYAIIELDSAHKKALDVIKRVLIEDGRWDELTEFFGARNDWADVVKSIESHANQSQDDEQKVELYFRAAEIWEYELDQADKAQRAYERALQTDPSNVKAATRLAEIYRDGDQGAKLATVLEVILNASPIVLGLDQDPLLMEETARLINELTTLYEDSLRKPQQAFDWTARLISIAPHSSEAWSPLLRLAGQVRPPLHSEALALLSEARQRATGMVDVDHERDLCLMLAKVAREEIQDHDQALHFNHEALSIDPNSINALRNLESLHEEAEDWERVVEVLTALVDLSEADQHEPILLKIGRLYKDHLGLFDQAIDAYNNLLEVNAQCQEAIEALHVLYREQNDPNALYHIINREIELISHANDHGESQTEGPSNATLGLELELAMLEIEELDKIESAIERISSILEVHPSQPVAVRALESIQDNPNYGKLAAQLLTEIYREREEWSPYVNSLSIIARDLVDSSERVSLLEEMSSIYLDHLQDDEGAQSSLIALLREQPDHESAIDSLYTVVERTQDWTSFAAVYEDVIYELGELDKELHHLLSLAVVYEEKLEDSDNAIKTYQRVYAAASDSEPALLALERLYTQIEDWRSLLEILRSRYEVSLNSNDGDSDQSVEMDEGSEANSESSNDSESNSRFSALSESLLLRISELYEYTLQDPHEAIASHQELLAYLPERYDSFEALSRLFEQVEQWSELVQSLESLLSNTELEDDSRLVYLTKLADTFYQHLERYDELLIVCDDLLKLSSQDAQAISYLEHLVQLEEYKGEAARLLSPVYAQVGQLEHQIYTLQILAEVQDEETTSGLSQKVDYLHQVARLYLEAGAAQESYDTYQQALFADPTSSVSLESLTEIVATSQSWDVLAQTYENLIPELNEPSLLALRSKELGALYLEQLQSVDDSIRSYETAKTALEPIIIDLFSSRDEEEPRLEDEEEPRLEDEEEPRLEDEEEPRLEDEEEPRLEDEEEPRLEDEEEPRLEDLNASPPVKMMEEVYEALTHLYTQVERWPALTEITIERADLSALVSQTERQMRFLLQAASLCTEQLADSGQAIDLYQQTLALEPGYLPSLEALELLYSERGDWREFIETIESKTQLGLPELDSATLRLQVAQAQVQHLGDLESAVESYSLILEEVPHHTQALYELADVYVNLGRSLETLETLDTLALHVQGEAKHQVSLRAALLVRTDLEDHHQAIERLKALLTEAPQYESAFIMLEEMIDERCEAVFASEVLTNALEHIGDFGRLVNAWRRLLSVTEDRNEQAALWMKVGHIYQEVFLDETSAFEAYAYALRAAPLTLGTYPSMFKIISQTEDAWPRLAEELEVALNEMEQVNLEEIGGTETLKSLHGWVSEIYEERLGDDQNAIHHLLSMRELSPTQDQPLISLERLYERNSQWEDLAEVLKERVILLDQRVDLEDPQTDLEDPQTDLEDPQADLEDPQTDLEDPQADLEDPQTDLEDPQTDLEDPQADLDETLLGDELVADEYATDEPVADEYAADEPVADEPVADEPVADEPVADEPVADEPVADEPATSEPVADEPATSERYLLKLTLLQKLARVYSVRLSLTDEAVETYREVFEISPADQEAVVGLNQLFVAGEAQEEIAEILDPIYRAQELWEPLYIQKQTLLTLRPAGEIRREACQELANLSLEQLGDVQSALGWYGEGFKEEPQHEECRVALHQLAIEHGFAGALVTLYAEAREGLSDPLTTCDLSVHIAHVQMDILEDWEAAEREFSYARQFDDNRLDVFIGLDRVYSSLEQWAPLEDVLLNELRLIEQGDEQEPSMIGEMNSLNWRLADLYEYRLGQSERAVEVFQHLMALQPDEIGPALRLENLYRELGRFDELADIYLFQEERLEGDEAPQSSSSTRETLNSRIGTSTRCDRSVEEHLRSGSSR